jgi:hypothetical protein
MKIKYIDRKFKGKSLKIIDDANAIIEEYNEDGYDLTLRQLYYQFISLDLFPDSYIDPETNSKNHEKSYKRFGNIISNARLAGLIDWSSIRDRTRMINSYSSWESIPEIIESAQYAYCVDRWRDQKEMVEVWVEKDALIDVMEKACERYEVPHFACRGYVSQSAMWGASQRINNYDKMTNILYLGDHDPSGIDMIRDINDRLSLFGAYFCLFPVALNMDQVKKYNLPPNPTKVKDKRSMSYIEEYGEECWELDAIKPDILVNLIRKNIEKYIDFEILDKVMKIQKRERNKIKEISKKFII